ncbi:HNH endonuclease signature motif containing protein [Paracraurococcus ruber]|uniref:HNH endonuclease signature motif containing protein n=1 Tax=Paracraurococcus ruber TaxID=77675 RepID=UPI00105835FD|nr:HNH endonuclease [Paracraurococcus ruber]
MVHHYSRTTWRKIRDGILAAQPKCETPGCHRASVAVDHDPPLSAGGSDTTSRLRAYCTSCHNRRTALGNATPRAVGCDATGQPNDPGHWWNRDSRPQTAPGSPSRRPTALSLAIERAQAEKASTARKPGSAGPPRRSR